MKLTLTNFQIHKRAEVEIPEGRTTYLEGDSDTGKSSKLRALRWVCENKPDGGSFVTFKTPRGTNARVELEIDGHLIARERGKSKNIYSLDGETYEAFGRSVPEPILKVLNLSPYAFQLQGEPPFLIGATATEAAKILSDACGLGVIDTAVGHVRAKKTAVDADIRKSEILLESAQRRQEEAERQIPLAEALDRAASLGEEVAALESRCAALSGALGAEPAGRTLDLAAAQERAAAARQAWSDVQLGVNRLASLRGAVASAPIGEPFGLDGLAGAVQRTWKILNERDAAMARIPPIKQLLASEPQGGLYDVEGVRPLLREAKVVGEWLESVGFSVGQMRRLIAEEPTGEVFGLGNIHDLLADADLADFDRVELTKMKTSLKVMILAEPSGVPMDTTELMKQRAQIKVCPQCGREL